MKKYILPFVMVLTLISFSSSVEAASTYKVKSGDTLWNISQKYDVALPALRKVNHKYDNYLEVGDQLTIPSSISKSEKNLLARLVHAEAKGEPYAGKVAVATVVLNRVDSPKFPNTVKEVIYEKAGGYYAFTPVKNGQIYAAANAESKRAVEEAIKFRGKGSGSLYFYNPNTAKSAWVFSRETTITIGNHRFAK